MRTENVVTLPNEGHAAIRHAVARLRRQQYGAPAMPANAGRGLRGNARWVEPRLLLVVVDRVRRWSRWHLKLGHVRESEQPS